MRHRHQPNAHSLPPQAAIAAIAALAALIVLARPEGGTSAAGEAEPDTPAVRHPAPHRER